MSSRALVIGLGQIGMGYDLKLDPTIGILTHARAFQQHYQFTLVGGVDNDPVRRQAFESHYAVPAYADVVEALQVLRPEVIAIATPTALHAPALTFALNSPYTRAVLCEKPLSYESGEADEMVAECSKRGVGLYVNYFRRCDPGVIEIKRRLDAGEIGGPLKGVVWYSKGLLHNGSHFFNLLEYWLGEAQRFEVIDAGRSLDDSDVEPDVRVSFARGPVIFIAAREEDFSHYTVELVAPNGRLRYEQGGAHIIWQAAVPDPTFEKYITLTNPGKEIANGMHRSQWHVADQLAASMAAPGDGHICSGADALKTLKTLITIRSNIRSKS